MCYKTYDSVVSKLHVCKDLNTSIYYIVNEKGFIV